MEALYHRMDLAVASKSKEGDRKLARTLIEWIICAQRPLSLKELSQALSPDFPEFLDFKRTIEDVCGHFVVVEQTSRVVMVHQSARDYLTKTSNLQLSVNLKDSHENTFFKSMSYLLSPNTRSKLERDELGIRNSEPFLAYAATSWPYHLRQAATGSRKALTLLINFFGDPSVLSWVHSLALLREMGVLVKSARSLSSFVVLNKKLNAEKSPLLHRLQDLELLDIWATDLLKIVGKFGRRLLQDPTAIYGLVPPFCPTDSNMYRQFHTSRSSKLSVSGISNITWDDCLARIALPNNAKAWKIACAGNYFAVLDSAGTILLGDAITLQEICNLPHEEHVTAMCFNTGSSRLVSYGVKTTKVWAVPSGDLLSSIPSPPDSKAMAITFTDNDTQILMASDDKLIRCLCTSTIDTGWQYTNPALLKETSSVEGGLITSPCCMAFNPDATQIAIAYRGFPLSVWSTFEPRLIGRCKRVSGRRADHGRPSVSWMAVDRFAWNPTTGHLVGLYKDGSIFKWHPTNDETQEASSTADELEVSLDGKLFLTSDTNGTVKLWNFAYFSVIYQLSSESLVTSLAFSPDSKRFYDLRGSSINAWEPNTLLRLTDAEEASSDTASDSQTLASASQASEAWIGNTDPICSLVNAPQSLMHCAANEDGQVNLFDVSRGKLLEILKSPNFLAVNCLSWGKDLEHIAAADSGRNVTVIRLDKNGTDCFKIISRFSAKADVEIGGIRQVLLDSNSKRLLVVGQRRSQVLSVGNGNIESSSIIENGNTSIWINHPLHNSLMIKINPGGIDVFEWEDLSKVSSFNFYQEGSYIPHESSYDAEDYSLTSHARISLNPRDENLKHSSVRKALLTQDGDHVLVQISKWSSLGKLAKETFMFKISSLEQQRPDSTTIETLFIPVAVSSKIEVPLGILLQGKLVFLDRDLWICSFRLGSSKAEIKRQYFIPRDWASTDTLDLCCLLHDGTFLLPKDGEVAVITSNVGDPDW